MKAIRYGLMALAGMFAIAPTAQAQVIISMHVTRNMQCSGGVCTPTAAKAWLNVYDLERMLGQENVTVETNAAAQNIVSNAAFSWSSSFGLTLEAVGNLTINHTISDTGSGPAQLIYNASGGNGGMLSFGLRGRLTFSNLSAPLSINGQPYTLVNTIAALARYIADNPSGDFALAANYNARHDGTYTQSPITTPFAGIFEGLGNTITNLVVEDQNNNSQGDGFFYQTTQYAVLANLVVKSATIDGQDVAGGLVADNQGYLLLDSFDGNVQVVSSGNPCAAGGLTGINDGIIGLSNASGAVTDDSSCTLSSRLGGLVGRNGSTITTATIGTSYATGNVTSIVAESSVGGLAGDSQGSIGASSASGAATGGPYAAVGGLLGINNGGSNSNTSATGAATGDHDSIVGGLVGYNAGGTVDTCTAKGAASGGDSSDVGGAFGINYMSYVSNCVSYGAVTAGSSSYLGGFIGDDYTADSGYLSNDSWDITTSGNSCAAGNSCTDDGVTGFY